MAPPLFSYTQKIHNTSYNEIDPTSKNLRTQGKVILITGASGGIGSATAKAFAKSQPKAIILLGRSNLGALNATADSIRSIHTDLTVQTHLVDLCDSEKVLEVFQLVKAEFGSIDILVHAAGFLPQPALLIDTKPETFLNGYKTTVVGTLAVAQAFVKANQKTVPRSITFINLTSAAIFFPADPKLGAYVSCKIAAFKLLECFAQQNKCVRLHQVHPGYFETEMSKKLEKDVTLGYEKDDSEYRNDPSHRCIEADGRPFSFSFSLPRIRFPCLDCFSRGRISYRQVCIWLLGC